MTRIRTAIAFTILAMFCAAAGQSQEKKNDIVMTHVKYDGLKQEVLKHRGKVVIVDFWATWCPNCIKAFPNFIEMEKNYKDKGLVVIAVYLDDAKAEGAVEAANRFSRKNVSFRNLLLDEPMELWKAKFDFESLPAYFIFDRHGKWVRFRGSDYPATGVPYDELEKVVVQMLNEK